MATVMPTPTSRLFNFCTPAGSPAGNSPAAFAPGTVRVEVQAAVHVQAQDRKQRLVGPAVERVAHRHPQIDPHAVRHPVAVVVDVPLALTGRDPVPGGIEVRIAAGEVGVIERNCGRNITCRNMACIAAAGADRRSDRTGATRESAR